MLSRHVAPAPHRRGAKQLKGGSAYRRQGWPRFLQFSDFEAVPTSPASPPPERRSASHRNSAGSFRIEPFHYRSQTFILVSCDEIDVGPKGGAPTNLSGIAGTEVIAAVPSAILRVREPIEGIKTDPVAEAMSAINQVAEALLFSWTRVTGFGLAASFYFPPRVIPLSAMFCSIETGKPRLSARSMRSARPL